MSEITILPAPDDFGKRIVTSQKILRDEAGLDEVIWAEGILVRELATATAMGGSHYNPELTYQWPPKQSIERFELSRWDDGEVHWALRVRAELIGVRA